MKKFIINSIPMLAGILIALVVATLCTGGYKNNEDSTSSRSDDTNQVKHGLSLLTTLSQARLS